MLKDQEEYITSSKSVYCMTPRCCDYVRDIDFSFTDARCITQRRPDKSELYVIGPIYLGSNPY